MSYYFKIAEIFHKFLFFVYINLFLFCWSFLTDTWLQLQSSLSISCSMNDGKRTLTHLQSFAFHGDNARNICSNKSSQSLFSWVSSLSTFPQSILSIWGPRSSNESSFLKDGTCDISRSRMNPFVLCFSMHQKTWKAFWKLAIANNIYYGVYYCI